MCRGFAACRCADRLFLNTDGIYRISVSESSLFSASRTLRTRRAAVAGLELLFVFPTLALLIEGTVCEPGASATGERPGSPVADAPGSLSPGSLSGCGSFITVEGRSVRGEQSC